MPGTYACRFAPTVPSKHYCSEQYCSAVPSSVPHDSVVIIFSKTHLVNNDAARIIQVQPHVYMHACYACASLYAWDLCLTLCWAYCTDCAFWAYFLRSIEVTRLRLP